MKRIIIDTDIGTDFDDAAALALAMKANQLKIEGITTVNGDTALRAKLAKKLLRLGGREDVPVYAGLGRTLLGNRAISWIGHEGEGVLEKDDVSYDSGNAIEFIIRTVMDNPGQITLVSIGAMTNIAAAIIVEPRLVHHVKEIIIMGGYVRIGCIPAEVDPYDSNVICDPEAASVVFSSGAAIVMVGLDVTYQASIHMDDFLTHFQEDNPLHNALLELLRRWLKERAIFKPKLNKFTTFMHDALAVSLLLDPTIVQMKQMNVQVKYDHQLSSGTTIATPDIDGNVMVCTDVDVPKFSKLFFSVMNEG